MITVTFIDDEVGDALGVTEMESGRLPDGFEGETRFQFGEDEWRVVQAVPKTREEFEKAKKLTLRIRLVEKVDPAEILYSLPSICDAIPGVGEKELEGDELLLEKDDWRQLELVSSELADTVDEELEKIRLIHEHEAEEVGWRKIHVRTKPEVPLNCKLDLAELEHSLQASASAKGVAYRDENAQIANGFAIVTQGLSVYGMLLNNHVHTLAIHQFSEGTPTSDSILRLKRLALDLKLDLVHWCRCARVAPDDPLFALLLLNSAK